MNIAQKLIYANKDKVLGSNRVMIMGIGTIYRSFYSFSKEVCRAYDLTKEFWIDCSSTPVSTKQLCQAYRETLLEMGYREIPK